ncbi:unnamed protein product [Penicillium salamii]|uniref:Uncharacterized protein n=1 Tax=Penicillium salamii TaxID=1612424 RepID=A0A9W4JE47_9EURO|nr:unnamed protein product [Penicillium salamii]
MASNPAMLLDPKGAKRQAQRNGNDPNSSPPHHSLPVDPPTNEAGEPPKDSPGHLDRSSNPASPLAPASPEVAFSASSLPSVDTSGNIGEEAEAATEICTPAISLDSLQVMPTDAPVPPEDDVNLLPQLDPETLVGTPPVPVDSANDPDIDMECAAGPPEPSPLDVTYVSHDPQSEATTRFAEPTELAELPDPVSESPLRSPPILDTIPSTADMSSAESECPGLLLDHTGKQSMAPAGTATVTQRREPTPRTPITINSAASSPAPQSTRNLEVQFSTAQDDENESDAKRSYHELSDDEDKLDQRNLIADVYGAEQRKRQPVKRVKTANEQSSAANTQISIAGSNGLGKWMKEGEEAPTPSTVFDTVDLTKDLADTTKEDDDDEIECTGSTDLSTQRVCYGKIDGALIQASFVPKPTDSSFFIDENSWPSMKVELRRPANIMQGDIQINVVDPHNFIFGKIDAKTAQGLCPLLDDTVISTVDVTARLNTRRRYLGESVWAPTSGFWHATINVYGQRQRADGIGRFLAHRNSCGANMLRPRLLPVPVVNVSVQQSGTSLEQPKK